jgi:methionine synthase II (cobalamin-independent)
MSKQVGMSRNISLDYLDKTIELMKNEDDIERIREDLREYIGLYIDDNTNIRKTANILSNIWLEDDEENRNIKDYARKIVKSNNDNLKLVAHWCMMLITYNVFKDIASVIGKLEYMQIEIASRFIREKMTDMWGERPTLIHAIPKNIRTMRDTNVLETVKQGVYKVKKHKIDDERAIILIVATLIHLKDKLYLSFDELIDDSLMFPFDYSIDVGVLEESNMFSFDRFGGELAISLKENFK